MATKICKVCGKEKDSVEGFYKSSGRVCCVCKNQRRMENAKEAKGLHMALLMEIRDNQRELMERMDELQENFGERMDGMEQDVEKLRKKLKKLSAK